MFTKAIPAVLASGLLASLVLAPAGAASINKDINLGDNSQNGSQSSVNGSITVGNNSVVDGSLSTVNGTIRIGENTRLKDAETVNGSVRIGNGSSVSDVESVNGSIRLGEQVSVDGEVTVVNGKITLGNGTQVADEVSNVNGEITLTGADVGGDVSTVSGDITLEGGSVVQGDVVVEKPGGWFNSSGKRKPIVTIGPESRVNGEIVLEREVELYISESAEIGGVRGKMSMDDAVRFTGERP